MRSPKSRSRNKNNNNRNRSGVNVVNRVFDSSGPEGKVRGTPQQIIDKYTQLARDAQLSNDRVAAENFQQHGEHYIRLLGEAQREMEAKRLQQEREQRERQQIHQEQQQQNRDEQHQRRDARGPVDEQPATPQPSAVPDPSQADQPDTIDPVAEPVSGLVETPEEAKPKRRSPRPRKPKAEKPGQPDAPEAAE